MPLRWYEYSKPRTVALIHAWFNLVLMLACFNAWFADRLASSFSKNLPSQPSQGFPQNRTRL